MASIFKRTVLFADLRGSTSMYEKLGNVDAAAVVTQSVAQLARTVTSNHGHVVKTLGDGLLATFESPSFAVAAADEMHLSMQRVDASDDSALPARALLVPLKLQVGLAMGEVMEISGDVFGDAVNVAARLLDHAGDNETLATETVIDGLNDIDRTRFRSLDRMQLRGRVESVHVYLLDATSGFGDYPATIFGDYLPAAEPEGIRLVWLDIDRIYTGDDFPVELGRGPQVPCGIDDTRVSRSHARIDWHGGTFSLTDLSYNGTYVRFDHDPEIISLRRGNCTLHGSGVIGLGISPIDVTCPTVRFEILKVGDSRDTSSAELTPEP